MKKKLMLIGALVLSFALVSCGGKKEEAPKAAAKTEAAAKTAEAKEMTVAEYKEEVQKITKEIEEVGKPMQSVNPGDPTAAMKTAKEVIAKIAPLYEKLGSLKAPASLAGAQSKLKDGADASLELIKASSEMFEFASNPSAAGQADVMKKMQEIQGKMADLQSKAQGMSEAMTEIMNAK